MNQTNRAGSIMFKSRKSQYKLRGEVIMDSLSDDLLAFIPTIALKGCRCLQVMTEDTVSNALQKIVLELYKARYTAPKSNFVRLKLSYNFLQGSVYEEDSVILMHYLRLYVCKDAYYTQSTDEQSERRGLYNIFLQLLKQYHDGGDDLTIEKLINSTRNNHNLYNIIYAITYDNGHINFKVFRSLHDVLCSVSYVCDSLNKAQNNLGSDMIRYALQIMYTECNTYLNGIVRNFGRDYKIAADSIAFRLSHYTKKLEELFQKYNQNGILILQGKLGCTLRVINTMYNMKLQYLGWDRAMDQCMTKEDHTFDMSVSLEEKACFSTTLLQDDGASVYNYSNKTDMQSSEEILPNSQLLPPYVFNPRSHDEPLGMPVSLNLDQTWSSAMRLQQDDRLGVYNHLQKDDIQYSEEILPNSQLLPPYVFNPRSHDEPLGMPVSLSLDQTWSSATRLQQDDRLGVNNDCLEKHDVQSNKTLPNINDDLHFPTIDNHYMQRGDISTSSRRIKGTEKKSMLENAVEQQMFYLEQQMSNLFS